MQAWGRAFTCRLEREFGCGQQADSPLGARQSPSRAALGTTVRVFSAFSGPACLPYSGEPSHRICRVSRQPLLGGGAHLAASPDARGLRIFRYSNETPPPLPWRQGRNPSAVEKRKPSLKRATAAVEGPRDAPRTWAPWPTPQVRARYRFSMSFVLGETWAEE